MKFLGVQIIPRLTFRMNDYLIKYKISTVSELIKPFEYEGYSFSSYSEEWWNCGAWVASKTIRAKNAGEARFRFLNELMPLVEHFSTISQCGFRFIANSYFIYKLTNNEEKIVFIYYVRPVSYTGLHFDDQEINQLEKIKKIQNKKGFFYIMEAANATTFYTRLTMLIGAVEGFSGEVTTKGQVKTNLAVVKKILNDELFDRLYKYGTGLRHKLLHGNIEGHHLFEGINDELYKKITEYLKSEFDIHLEESVVQPQRNFYGNFEKTQFFMKFRKDPVLDLKIVEEAVNDRYGRQPKLEMKIFNYVGKSPKDY